MNDLKNRTLAGIKIISFLEIFRYLSELFILIFTARILSPDDFGIVAKVLMVIALSDTFTQFGFSTPIIQFKEDTKYLINIAWTSDLVRSILLSSLLIIFSDQISIYLNNEIIKYPLIILSLRPVLQTLINPYLNYLIRQMILKQYFLIFLSSILLRLILVIPLTFYFKNYWALVIGAILATLIKVLISYLVIDYKPKFEFNLIDFKKLFSFSIWLLISRLYQIIFKNFPYIALNNLISLSYIGGYRLSENIGTFSENIYKKFSSKIILPSLSEVNRTKKNHKEILEKNLILICSSIIFFMIPSCYFSEIIINILLGEKWLFMDLMLKNFFILGGLLMLNSYLVSMSISIGYPKFDAIIKIMLLPLLTYFILNSSNEIYLIKTLQIAVLINIIFLKYLTQKILKINLIEVLKMILIYIYPILLIFVLILLLNQTKVISAFFFCLAVISISFFQIKLKLKNIFLEIYQMIR